MKRQVLLVDIARDSRESLSASAGPEIRITELQQVDLLAADNSQPGRPNLTPVIRVLVPRPSATYEVIDSKNNRCEVRDCARG